ncbi:uncharacterized protein [Antedon mediterranea]|uniref:uncharacterized protein n=1 Tax=Antedon mediterranea TaxID=105859 RepID=UPI003AF50528
MTSSSSKNGSKFILTELYYNLTHDETITYSDTPVSRPTTRPNITSSSQYPSESDKTTTDFISTIKLTEEEARSTITGQNKNNSYDERKTVQFKEITTTLIDVTVTKTTGSLNIIATIEQKVESEDGYHINDVYVLLAISLVIITIWLLLAFFLYIIVCNRVSSSCSTHSSKSRGVYSNTAHVSVVVATEEGIFDDDGIEILRTAL